MTIHLEEPADLVDLVGSPLGTTKWMKLSQQQVDFFAESTGDHQWTHTDPQRAARASSPPKYRRQRAERLCHQRAG